MHPFEMPLGSPKLEPVFLTAWLLIGALMTSLDLSTRGAHRTQGRTCTGLLQRIWQVSEHPDGSEGEVKALRKAYEAVQAPPHLLLHGSILDWSSSKLHHMDTINGIIGHP